MAIFHIDIKVGSRSNNKTATAASAYRSASKLTLKFTKVIPETVIKKLIATTNEAHHILDKDTGKIIGLSFDYSKKKGVIHSEILAPKNAPDWSFDREKLWQRVEESEKRIDSQLFREFEFSLPKELTKEQNIELARDFISRSLVSRGMIVDFSIHYDDENNPHVHPMATMRKLVENEEGTVDFSPDKATEWNSRQIIRDFRHELANVINKHLLKHGINSQVSHLSYKDLEIDQIPTIHEGGARHIPGSRLTAKNQQIMQMNLEKIFNNPAIIINKIDISKPYFTLRDIEQELLVY